MAGVSETGRPRGFPPWASPDRAEAFALLAEYLPHLVQAADLADAERWQHEVVSTFVLDVAQKHAPVLDYTQCAKVSRLIK